MTTSYQDWPFSEKSVNDAEMWKSLFRDQHLSAQSLRALLSKTGIPTGVTIKMSEEVPLIAAYFWKFFAHQHDALKSVSVSDALPAQLHDEEAIFLAFQKLEQYSPLSKFVDVPSNWFELALHGGFDELAKELLSHPEFPESKIWQSWTSGTGAQNGTGGKLPWLHFLATTSRLSIVEKLCSREKVNINQLDRLGRSPIFYAKSEGMLKVLLQFSPDLTLKGKDGQGMVETWASLGVLGEDLSTMRALVSGEAAEDKEKIQLNGWLSEIVQNIKARSNWMSSKDAFNLPEIDWALMHQKRIDKVLGGRTYSLSAMDWFSLGVLETKGAEEQKAMYYYARSAYQAKIESLVTAYQHIFAHTIPAPTESYDGFFTYLVLNNLMPAKNNWTHYAAWLRDLDTQLGGSAKSRMIQLLQFFQEMSPVFNRTGKLTRFVFDQEIKTQFNGIGNVAFRQMWENSDHEMSPDEHEKFWTLTLRASPVGGALLEKMLELNTYKTLPHAHLSKEQQASLYAAATSLLVSYSSEHEYHRNRNDKLKLLKGWLRDWLDQQVPWHAKAEDYKWANKPDTLQSIELGPELIARVSRGRLNKKITQQEETPAPPPSKARRL